MELDPPSSTGKFSLTVFGLSASTSYYFRAFAKNNTITVYSEEKAFTTRPAADNMVMALPGTAIDYDTAAVYRYYTGVYSGHSVRCVKDE